MHRAPTRHSPCFTRIKHFTPAWHTINLGTGIIALIFLDLPYIGKYTATQYITLIIHLLNCLLWVALTSCSLIRYITFPFILRNTLKYPEHGLYVGAFPMSLAVIILGSILVIYDKFGWGGRPFVYALWGCWWINVTLSLLCCFGQVHMMISRQELALESMTTLWLLPIVTLVIASSCGASMAKYLAIYNNHHASYTTAVSLILVICGTVSTFMINTIYLHRLVVYGLPQSTSIYSAFLPVGTISQAGLALDKIGALYGQTLALHPPVALFPNIPNLIEFTCLAWCFTLWAVASASAVGAILAVLDMYRSQRLPFKITFWGIVFPNVRVLRKLDSSARCRIRFRFIFNHWAHLFNFYDYPLAGSCLLYWTRHLARRSFSDTITHSDRRHKPFIHEEYKHISATLRITSLL